MSRTDPVFRIKQHVIVQTHEMESTLADVCPQVNRLIDRYSNQSSGWVVYQTQTLWLDFSHCEPMKGISYKTLPKTLANKKTMMNVKKKDDQCLGWVLKSTNFAVLPSAKRTTKNPKNNGLIFSGENYPNRYFKPKKLEGRTRQA